MRELVNKAPCEPISVPCRAKKALFEPTIAFTKASLTTKWANFASREAKKEYFLLASSKGAPTASGHETMLSRVALNRAKAKARFSSEAKA